jgi:hypothetical protein
MASNNITPETWSPTHLFSFTWEQVNGRVFMGQTLVMLLTLAGVTVAFSQDTWGVIPDWTLVDGQWVLDGMYPMNKENGNVTTLVVEETTEAVLQGYVRSLTNRGAPSSLINEVLDMIDNGVGR